MFLLLQRSQLTIKFVVGNNFRLSNFRKMSTNSTKKTLNELKNTSTSVSSSSCIVAVTQMCATNDKHSNLCKIKELLTKAKSQSASFVFLPECCDFIGENRQETLELSEPLTGNTMQEYKTLAKQYNMWLSLGGLHEAVLDIDGNKTNKIFNAHVLINNCGDIVSIYRKLHLFDVDTPEVKLKESDVVTAGNELVPPVDTPIGRIGLQICYDLRFPESSILLRKSNAEILTYPSAFTYTTGKAHWELLLRTRAIENQCYVIAAAQIGQHNRKRRSWGHALIVNPWGKILADCGGDEQQQLNLGIAEIDASTIIDIRANMPCFNHRRDDIYKLIPCATGTLDAKIDRQFANNIISKETIFYETEYCFAFTNLRCVVIGHVLVSTKRVMQRLCELNCVEMSDLFQTVCKIQRMLETFYKTTSATVTVQDGIDAGQTVPHVHFHVMPRRPGDFGHNDQIYVKMDDRCEDKPNRSLQERIDEAQKYKEFLRLQI